MLAFQGEASREKVLANKRFSPANSTQKNSIIKQREHRIAAGKGFLRVDLNSSKTKS